MNCQRRTKASVRVIAHGNAPAAAGAEIVVMTFFETSIETDSICARYLTSPNHFSFAKYIDCRTISCFYCGRITKLGMHVYQSDKRGGSSFRRADGGSLFHQVDEIESIKVT
jgi:hypothetical protein